jgi:hypothetical protein
LERARSGRSLLPAGPGAGERVALSAPDEAPVVDGARRVEERDAAPARATVQVRELRDGRTGLELPHERARAPALEVDRPVPRPDAGGEGVGGGRWGLSGLGPAAARRRESGDGGYEETG